MFIKLGLEDFTFILNSFNFGSLPVVNYVNVNLARGVNHALCDVQNMFALTVIGTVLS